METFNRGTKVKEYEVFLFYRACVKYKVQANSCPEAHKKAHAEFMDTPIQTTLNNSNVDNVNEFFIETSVEGREGSDMIHD